MACQNEIANVIAIWRCRWCRQNLSSPSGIQHCTQVPVRCEGTRVPCTQVPECIPLFVCIPTLLQGTYWSRSERKSWGVINMGYGYVWIPRTFVVLFTGIYRGLHTQVYTGMHTQVPVPGYPGSGYRYPRTSVGTYPVSLQKCDWRIVSGTRVCACVYRNMWHHPVCDIMHMHRRIPTVVLYNPDIRYPGMNMYGTQSRYAYAYSYLGFVLVQCIQNSKIVSQITMQQ